MGEFVDYVAVAALFVLGLVYATCDVTVASVWLRNRYTRWRYPERPLVYLKDRKSVLANDLAETLAAIFPEMNLNVAHGIARRPDGALDFAFRIQRIDEGGAPPAEVAEVAVKELRRLEPQSRPDVRCTGIGLLI